MDTGLCRDLCLECIWAHQWLAMNALHLQRVEETLNRRIVVAIAPPAHAGHKAVFANQITMLPATIHTATIGMHDDTARCSASGNGCLERITGQVRIVSCMRRPANDLASTKIHHHRQIQPALSRLQESDIPRPLLIRALRAEVLAQHIGCYTQGVFRLRRAPIAPGSFGSEPHSAHAAGHCVFVHADALSGQLPGQARGTIAAFLGLEELDHFGVPLGSEKRALRSFLRLAKPGIVATARYAQNRTLAGYDSSDAGKWRHTSVQLLCKVRRGISQDLDLFGLLSQLAFEPGIFLSKSQFSLTD